VVIAGDSLPWRFISLREEQRFYTIDSQHFVEVKVGIISCDGKKVYLFQILSCIYVNNEGMSTQTMTKYTVFTSNISSSF
jgi:hypothetical protein